jgi:2-dehydro-3-deoxygluconokinase
VIWQAIGGSTRAIDVNRLLAGHVDVMFGNEEDFNAALGYEIEGVGDAYDELELSSYRAMLEQSCGTTRT